MNNMTKNYLNSNNNQINTFKTSPRIPNKINPYTTKKIGFADNTKFFI